MTSTVRVTCFSWYVLSARMFLPLSCLVNFMLPLFISLSRSLSLNHSPSLSLSLSIFSFLYPPHTVSYYILLFLTFDFLRADGFNGRVCRLDL